MAKITAAQTAGFCPGVYKAISMLNEVLDKGEKSVGTLGLIIHNRQVVSEFESRGVKVFEKTGDIKECDCVVIRAHGVAPSVYSSLAGSGLRYIDTTCPYVKKIHRLVRRKKDEGYDIIIIGDKNHPEVEGINGWCDDEALIVGTEEEAYDFKANVENAVSKNAGCINMDGIEDKKGIKKTCIVAQTTITNETWERITGILAEKLNEPEIHKTLCRASTKRQEEAAALSSSSDMMIVIGSKESSNTNKLFEICSSRCPETYRIETAADIPPDAGKGRRLKTIGITAGASAPEKIIREVIDKMIERFDSDEPEIDFQEALENSMIALRSGSVIRGRVFAYNDSEVFVDIGYKADGIIALADYSNEPDFDPKKSIRIGEEIEVYVVRVNDGDGNVILSKKKADAIKQNDFIEEACKENKTINVKVTAVVNSGVLAGPQGAEIFIPASQLGDRYISDLSGYLGKEIKIRLLEYNRQKRSYVGSERAVLKEEQEEKAKELWETIEAGRIYKGTVRNIADFGVFVDIGGADGLIHISELSWKRFGHPSEVLKTGDVAEVRVLDFDRDNKRISLSYRRPEDDPWNIGANLPREGDIIEGEVVKLLPFGAFVAIVPGIDGLVHISKISEKRISKPGEILKTGQKVKAKVMEVNAGQKKISLSIVDAEENITEKYKTSETAPEDGDSGIDEKTGEAVAGKADQAIKEEEKAEVPDKEAIQEEKTQEPDTEGTEGIDKQ